MLKWAVFPKPPEFRKRVVSSGQKRCSRAKMYSSSRKLSMNLSKELLERGEAEIAYHNARDKASKERAELKLRVTNSKIQMLRQQMLGFSSSAERIPMITLSLRETNEVDMMEGITSSIENHYHTNGEEYEESIAQLMDLRQSLKSCIQAGVNVDMHLVYFKQMEFVEKRFCNDDGSSLLKFEWYDSITGIPSQEKNFNTEKISILFNAAALYSQAASQQSQRSVFGLEASSEYFLKSAGILEYILDNFPESHDTDLLVENLLLLIQLMVLQAKEANY